MLGKLRRQRVLAELVHLGESLRELAEGAEALHAMITTAAPPPPPVVNGQSASASANSSANSSAGRLDLCAAAALLRRCEGQLERIGGLKQVRAEIRAEVRRSHSMHNLI